MSALLASLAILLAPQAQEPDLSKKITFERVAMPAKRLVGELGQEAGLTLDVSQQTAAEILVVRFADVTAKEALDQIAKAVNGEWSKESGGTMRLIRSASTLNKEIAAERAEKIKAVQTEIKKQIELANKKPTKEELESEEFYPSPFADRNKEVLALLSRLNAADLVMEESDSRVVFSSNPTRMQKLLPGNLTPIVNSLVAEHQKEVAEFQKSKEERDEHINEEMRQWMEMMKSMGMDRDPKPFDGVPSKLLFIVEQRDFMGITATIRIYDSKGKAIIERQGSLGM